MNVNGYNNLNIYTGKMPSNSAQNTNFSANMTSPFKNDLEIDTFEYSKPSFNIKNADFSEENVNLSDELKDIKSKQGFIGKAWDGFKNLFGFGASSNKVEAKIKAYEKGEITFKEAKDALDKYKAGQEMVLDVTADMASGILAVGAFALAVPTGGASLAVGLGLATALGAGVKVGIKAGDALLNDREYSIKDLLYDSATGAINGLLAPVTNGIGASVTKTVGKKLGLTVVKEGTEEIVEAAAKQGIKSIITQQGVDVIGGTFTKRAAVTALGMAADGAIGGASDNMVRAALNGENIAQAGVQGAIGGLIMAPVIGGGFKVLGKAGKSLNNKITTSSVLPCGVNTKFSQGATGDCALLSTLDGLMSNPQTAGKIKNSITKSIAGDYNVTIGNQTVKVAKSQLTDEMLSDVTGIRIFEQAYKQLSDTGLDGGFSDVVAKQFGLNPIHITSDNLTDEILDRLSKEQTCVLSFGTKVNADGAIAIDGTNHYFTIRGIDPQAKKITLADTYSTAKTFELSYDDVKKFGLSIDGGSTKALDLPTSVRTLDDPKFRGLALSGSQEELKARQELVDTLQALLLNKTTYTQQDFALSDDVIRMATDLLAQSGTKEHEILTKLVKECYVSVKTPDDIKRILLSQYVSLPRYNDSTTIILNPSAINRKNIGSSNKYISQWCAQALDLSSDSIFDRTRITALQELIDNSAGKRITVMVPDDFSGSGRSLSLNTIEVMNMLQIPKDTQVDIILAPSSATTSAKKVFKYIENGDLAKLQKMGILESGGSKPDIELLQEFFASQGDNVHFLSSDRILTVPTIYETATYKSLTPEEKQVIELLLTSDGYFAPNRIKKRTGLTGYGRDNHGLNCTMASFPSEMLDLETGLYIRKSPNNNLSGAMPYSIADGVSIDKIKLPGAKIKEQAWTRQKQYIYDIIMEGKK